jgi:hypothetical protein
MQAPHFFEESGHSHAFAEGNLHMKGVLMKYHTPVAAAVSCVVADAGPLFDAGAVCVVVRGQEGAKTVLKKFPEGECDHFKLTELLAAANVALGDMSTPLSAAPSPLNVTHHLASVVCFALLG